MTKASLLPLARSFHSWICSIALQESKEFKRDRLPKVYPTSLIQMRKISNDTHSKLVGTKYESRAVYWKDLFNKFEDDK
jgi:hypothetical protein